MQPNPTQDPKEPPPTVREPACTSRLRPCLPRLQAEDVLAMADRTAALAAALAITMRIAEGPLPPQVVALLPDLRPARETAEAEATALARWADSLEMFTVS